MELIAPQRPGRKKKVKAVDLGQLHQKNLRMMEAIQTYLAQKIQGFIDEGKDIPEKLFKQFLELGKVIATLLKEGRQLKNAAHTKFSDLTVEELDAQLKQLVGGANGRL